MMNTRILFLCTGNSCRSQMAMRLLQALGGSVEAYSAGTLPAERVNPYAVRAMQEIGLDMDGTFPKAVDGYVGESWDYVITVCDNARESCPAFSGTAGCRLHWSFSDPALAAGADEEIMQAFRTVRDEIRARLEEFYAETIQEL